LNFFSLFKRSIIYKLKKKISIDGDNLSKKSLDDLFHYYGSDKANFFKKGDRQGHGYSNFYVNHLQHLRNKKINILEIGTHNGDFSNFISKVYSESHITTIDLDESDNQFINTYGRDKKEKLDEFLKLRNENLNRMNINFIKLNSLNII